jgi:hypothetical protein
MRVCLMVHLGKNRFIFSFLTVNLSWLLPVAQIFLVKVDFQKKKIIYLTGASEVN